MSPPVGPGGRVTYTKAASPQLERKQSEGRDDASFLSGSPSHLALCLASSPSVLKMSVQWNHVEFCAPQTCPEMLGSKCRTPAKFPQVHFLHDW